MSQVSNMKPGATRTPLQFYVLPRNVVLRIFTFLPLAALLRCLRINKRFRTLIWRTEELRPHLFLEPPSTSPPAADVPVFLHPVFGRLNFFAYHPAKAIRIGEGLDGIFLQRSSVREQFATSPALKEFIIRVISGGDWPYDTEIVIGNDNGVTVWNVVQGITGSFNQYEGVSFGDHFGVEACQQRNYDPKALMQNHEFLNPDLPFPTIIFPDRDCRTARTFIADYAFNTFAALPLVKLPEEWNIASETRNGPEAEGTDHEAKPEGSMGSEAMDIDNGSTRCLSELDCPTPIRDATMRVRAPKEEEAQSDVELSFKLGESHSPMDLAPEPRALPTKPSELVSPTQLVPKVEGLPVNSCIMKETYITITNSKPEDWDDAFA